MSILTGRQESVRSSSAAPHYASWQEAMKDAVRDPRELCRMVGLSDDLGSAEAAGQFPVFAPRGYIGRMRFGDPADPLLRQVLPIAAEMQAGQGMTDPVGDRSASLSPGLLQKYRGRVLMVTTGACAVHCRYCFRRHFPYDEVPHSPRQWEQAFEQIAADATLREVILSGGDPLTLVDGQLAELLARLTRIGHLARLRVHTRLPVLIPERITDELIGLLGGSRLTPIMVVHANCAEELTGNAAEALGRLVDGGIVVLNQTVLLRGVNDSVEALTALCERLVDLRVMPYYLHQFDRVAGAMHFEVPVAEGLRLITALRARLPGYAVPRYAQEVAGEPGKVVLA